MLREIVVVAMVVESAESVQLSELCSETEGERTVSQRWLNLTGNYMRQPNKPFVPRMIKAILNMDYLNELISRQTPILMGQYGGAAEAISPPGSPTVNNNNGLG